jgi:tetratricopeptide (TPR) repeat protein
MNWHPSIPELPELLTALREPTPGLMLLRFRSGLALRFLIDQLRTELPGRAVHEVPYAANSPDAPNGSPRALVESCQAHANVACPVIVLLPDPNELHEVEPATTARFWKQLNAHREPLGNATAQVLLCVSEAQAPYAFSHALDLLSWCSPKFELPQVPQGSLVIVPEGSPAALAGSTEDAMRTLVATHGPLWEDIHTSGRQPSDSDLRQIYFPLVLALLDQHRLEEARQLLDQAPPVGTLSPRARAELHQLRGELLVSEGTPREGLQDLHQALIWWQTHAKSEATDAVIQAFVERLTDRITLAMAELGHLDDAIALARTSLKRSQRRLSSTAGTPEELRKLSVAHSRLGDLLTAKGELEEASRHIAEDLEISLQVLAKDPGSPQSLADMGVVRLKSARVLFAQSKVLDAHKALDLALECTRAALARQPRSVQFSILLAAVLTTLGYAEMLMGNTALALRNLTEAESIGEWVARNSPLHRESHGNLLTIRALLAQLFEQTDPPAAKTAWERLAHQIEVMESRGPLPPREAELLKLARTKSLA